MKKLLVSILIVFLLLQSSPGIINASKIEGTGSEKIENTMPNGEKAFDGYILFTPEYSTKTYLIDNTGKVVHIWKSKHIQGLGIYLLEDGNLVRSDFYENLTLMSGGGVTGRVEMFDWGGNLTWDFVYANEEHCLHHDIEPLPNGNVLMIAVEKKTYDEAIASGRNPDLIRSYLLPDHVIEVKPTGFNSGEIVWEWHVWDHLIQDYDSSKLNYGLVEDHPELIDINFVGSLLSADWTHINSIDYNEDFDQILLSSPIMSEIWVIDHSTTTEEAAGHTGGNSGKGGDILYRWGNPQAYRRGNANDQKLFGQHDARWIESGCPGEGHITIFNNGVTRPVLQYSSVDEIAPAVDSDGYYFIESGSSYGPEEPIWKYTAENPGSLFSPLLSGAQRIPSGNTLICNAARGKFFEVTPEKNIVWQYTNQLPLPFIGSLIGFNWVFKIQYYPADYPGITAFTEDIQQSQNTPQTQPSSQPSTQPSSTINTQTTTISNTLLVKTASK